jgi:hypothetical protein
MSLIQKFFDFFRSPLTPSFEVCPYTHIGFELFSDFPRRRHSIEEEMERLSNKAIVSGVSIKISLRVRLKNDLCSLGIVEKLILCKEMQRIDSEASKILEKDPNNQQAKQLLSRALRKSFAVTEGLKDLCVELIQESCVGDIALENGNGHFALVEDTSTFRTLQAMVSVNVLPVMIFLCESDDLCASTQKVTASHLCAK